MHLPATRRCINLRKWALEAESVWRAVKESNDFASLKNLKHIREHRRLVTTLYKVCQIHSNKVEEWPIGNPLLYGIGEIKPELLDRAEVNLPHTVSSNL